MGFPATIPTPRSLADGALELWWGPPQCPKRPRSDEALPGSASRLKAALRWLLDLVPAVSPRKSRGRRPRPFKAIGQRRLMNSARRPLSKIILEFFKLDRIQIGHRPEREPG